VIALDRDPAAPGFQFADRRAIISTEDEQGIAHLAEAESVEGIIAPGIDWPVAIAARVAERMGLPHPIDGPTAGLAVSKLKQRERLAEAGVPQPAWQIVKSPEEALQQTAATSWVVKAPDRQGQKGLALVGSEDELPAAIARAIAESRSGVAIVEELVDGPEVTVNAFSVRGEFHPLTVTDRLTADPPAFGVALAHVWPSEAGKKAADVARAAVEALGIQDGPTYTQLRIGPDGPQVIEVAARVGGGHDAELVHAALGVDLNGLALQAALGESIWSAALHVVPQVGGAVVRFLVPPEGVLQEVGGVDEARAVEGVQEVRVYREPGHVFGPFLRGADRAGAVLAVGESRAEALTRSDEAARLVRFKVGAASLV
jgi:biotin carboxylase